MPFKIEDGAIFVSDAHENEKRRVLWDFLCEIEKENIKPSGLFLMGDIFDLLVGEVEISCKQMEKYIQKLDALAQKFPIYYFEGNHDFNLHNLFLHVKVFSFASQPVEFESELGKVLLSHGDRFEDICYIFYTHFIRNHLTCKILNFIDKNLNHIIYKKILSDQDKKNICTKIKNFEDKIGKKIEKYPKDNAKAIFEGHYHQNKTFTCKGLIYRNFSSFACEKSYFIFNHKNKIIFDEIKFKT
ncbi:MAG: UDP-2,3-diacylglucosamine diphosphatase [Campylobacteraceae bacterium]|nr:UDP-2,3-diacylglucosamine diphosphatase [Campylobacteraceae bacterium]